MMANVLIGQVLPGGLNDNYDKPKEKSENPFYFGIGVKGANLINDWGVETGISIGGYLSPYFAIDFHYYYLFTNNVKLFSDRPEFLRMEYYGLKVNPVLPIHKYIKLKGLGGLFLSHSSYSDNINFEQYKDLEGDWFFFSELGLGLDIGIYEPFVISLESNYRFASGVDFNYIKNTNLSGVNFGIIFKVEL